MTQSLDELLKAIYQFYARGFHEDDPDYQTTAEYRRLRQARIHAAAEGNPWRVLLHRLSARFPLEPKGTIENGSLHLPTGKLDAGYVGSFWLEPQRPLEKNHKIGFLVSFLVPCYTVYSSSHVAVPGTEPQDWSQQIRFTFTASEETYARAITEEIQAVFPDYEALPPELGQVPVPGVAAGNMPLGRATLYHCVFTDAW